MREAGLKAAQATQGNEIDLTNPHTTVGQRVNVDSLLEDKVQNANPGGGAADLGIPILPPRWPMGLHLPLQRR